MSEQLGSEGVRMPTPRRAGEMERFVHWFCPLIGKLPLLPKWLGTATLLGQGSGLGRMSVYV